MSIPSQSTVERRYMCTISKPHIFKEKGIWTGAFVVPLICDRRALLMNHMAHEFICKLNRSLGND